MRKAKIFSLILMPQVHQYVVILEELEGDRLLPIWIGLTEGNAIAFHLEKQKMPRPMTHDLLSNMFGKLNIKVEKVVINDLRESTYYATVHIKADAKSHSIDARPSDSMAIAVRANAPIFIDEKVFNKCPIIRKPISEEEAKAFRSRMKDLKPEDFLKEQG